MKQKLLIIMMLFASSVGFAQTITILAARAMSLGDTVTVMGILTNGSELGSIRYFQDATAGIAAYSSTMANTNRGDSVTVTGVLKEYNQLLEIDPVISFTVLSSNNTLPTPELIVPDSLNEVREAELLRINSATFTTNVGGTFSSNTGYNFTANGQTSKIYVRSGHPLIGTIVPSSPVDLVGICSQYSYTSPTDGYQLLCRDTADIIMANTIAINSKISEDSITQTSIIFNWTTNIAGTTELMYGNTPALGSSALGTGVDTTNHSIKLSGLTASELLYVKAFSVDGSDTAFAPIKVFITESASTGNVISYFNTGVDTTVSSGVNAVTLTNAIDDTLIAYIGRATTSIDFTMYNFDETGISSVSSALNTAYSNGVTVRVIYDGSAPNSGVLSLVSGIKKVASPTGSQYGIMHNKFIVIDAYDSDANVPLVWTGSTNLTDGQVNTDANSVVIIQDKSLAIAYTLEFNEMFGSSTATPDLTVVKFGPDKTDNTPHKFIIGGNDVECYFSPSDGTNDKLIETIDNADSNISISTMLITRSDIAYALQDAVNNNSAQLKVLVNSEGQCSSTVWGILSSLIGSDLREDADVTGIMHHKFMVVDEGANNPTLLVGSHNWSNSANNKNDENTLIFKNNQGLANIYYQSFKYRFDQNSGIVPPPPPTPSLITIAEARSKNIGDTVIVKGIITNGDELGPIRYFQDTTAGIAAYGSATANMMRGDSVIIKGILKEYGNLLEIDPILSDTILNSANTLPTPQIIDIDSIYEGNESELIRINNAVFITNPGGTFSSNNPYQFVANGDTSSIFVRSNHPLIGELIPSGIVSLIGIVSQHFNNYQLLCRDTNDIIMSNIIAINSKVSLSNLSQTGFKLSWSTTHAGTSEVMYGSTPALGNTMSSTGVGTSHSVDFTGLSASELVYAKVFSVNDPDTAFSLVSAYITQSTSSGEIVTYFNTEVDNTVSSGTDAITIPNAIDDTLIAYINRATTSIDFTMYNFVETGLSSVSSALNAAHNRGVTVRIVFDGGTTNSGIQDVIAAIKKVGSPSGSQYGIMHNKFIVIDAYANDANVPLVWTGSTNLTNGQINTDPNSVIIIQDKSLAIAYTLEFNEMFGSSSAIPDMGAIKFGPEKADNTPHNFIIDGKDVDCYFSPSDGTNDRIIETIKDADDNISVATMLITRVDIGYALEDAVNDNSVDLQVLVNSEGQCNATVWAHLSALLGDDLQEDVDITGIMHHKFMVVDEGTSNSPTLLVGSHNWSTSANSKNDENTLIFHDNQELANIYYQAFKYRFDENKNVGFADVSFANSVSCYPNPSNGQFTVEMNIEKATELTVNVFDLSGRNVYSQQQSAFSGNNIININASNLAKGTYLLQMINSDGKRFVNTLIIQ